MAVRAERLAVGGGFDLERIVALKVWGADGTILYSPNRALVGRTFPVRGGLAKALSGDVVADITDLSEVENEYERARWSRTTCPTSP